MKLRKLRIENFRAFSDATIDFDDYSCLVGPNGAGKSCVFAALNVLFRRPVSRGATPGELQEEDFHQRNTVSPIRITATFEGLSSEAQTDLAHYYRHGKLLVSALATWDERAKKAPVVQQGVRRVMQEFSHFFGRDAGGARVPELKGLYEPLRAQHALPP